MDHDAFVRMILEPVDLEESGPEPLLLVDVLEDAPAAPPLPPKPLARTRPESTDEEDHKVHLV